MNLQKVAIEVAIEFPIIVMAVLLLDGNKVAASIFSASLSIGSVDSINQIPDLAQTILVVAFIIIFMIVVLTSVAEFVYDTYSTMSSG